MSTVLGKRTRSGAEPADNVLTRSKRRIVVNEPNDENENPFLSHVDANAEESKVEEEEPSKKRACRSRTVPAKHGAPGRRIAVSPAKISSHFAVAKSAAVEVYQDGKRNTTQIPGTPRHRDALSKKVPITPRHRALASQNTPRTPRTPTTPSNAVTSVYNQARQLFSRCSNPGKLVGREHERQELSTFVKSRLESDTAGCLYVSGPPGTGKSALIDEVCQQYKDAEDVSISVVNCMSVRNAKDLSQKLCEDLDLKENAGFEYLRSCFLQGQEDDKRCYLVILDEVDCLVDLDLDLLYSLFDWSMQAKSRLLLIGIANALDLTDRLLPRLKGRNLKPDLLPFMPYSAAQIAEVLTSKLRTLPNAAPQTIPFLHPAAIQFCAKKVAAQTGDLRKAFDICRRAIDLVEQETKAKDAEVTLQDSPSKTPLMENVNLSSPPTPRSPSKNDIKTSSTRQPYTLATAPKATIAHMAKITSLVFSANNSTHRLSTLNLQQKAVLCSLAALEKRKRDTQLDRTMFSTPSKHSNTAAPSIKQLFEAYSSLCTRDKLLHPLSSVEFRDVVSGLETLNLVSAVDAGKKGASSFAVLPITPSRTPGRRGKGGFGAAVGLLGDEKRVASVVGFKEVRGAVEEGAGGELLREILEGGALV